MKRHAQVTKSTRTEIQKALSYEADTGHLRWKTRPSGCVQIGYIAGRRHQNGHLEVCFDGVTYMAHHLAWFLHYGKWPTHPILHVNKNKADNRLQNLVAKI